MMARHFPEKNEIRIYSVNDIPRAKRGLISYKHRIKTQNPMRKEPEKI
jgi:hypothetical protein